MIYFWHLLPSWCPTQFPLYRPLVSRLTICFFHYSIFAAVNAFSSLCLLLNLFRYEPRRYELDKNRPRRMTWTCRQRGASWMRHVWLHDFAPAEAASEWQEHDGTEICVLNQPNIQSFSAVFYTWSALTILQVSWYPPSGRLHSLLCFIIFRLSRPFIELGFSCASLPHFASKRCVLRRAGMGRRKGKFLFRHSSRLRHF